MLGSFSTFFTSFACIFPPWDVLVSVTSWPLSSLHTFRLEMFCYLLPHGHCLVYMLSGIRCYVNFCLMTDVWFTYFPPWYDLVIFSLVAVALFVIFLTGYIWFLAFWLMMIWFTNIFWLECLIICCLMAAHIFRHWMLVSCVNIWQEDVIIACLWILYFFYALRCCAIH